jgi:uncharacterized protein
MRDSSCQARAYLQGIASLADANCFLRERYIAEFNDKFT